LFDHGQLAGTDYLSILPVDQGIEHSAGASLAKNPAYFDPENIVRGQSRRLQRRCLDIRRAGGGGPQVCPQDPVYRQNQPQRTTRPRARHRNTFMGWLLQPTRDTYLYTLTAQDSTLLAFLEHMVAALQESVDPKYGSQTQQALGQRGIALDDLAVVRSMSMVYQSMFGVVPCPEICSTSASITQW
jgi:hypothetical protein